jgi:hypothetical protein
MNRKIKTIVTFLGLFLLVSCGSYKMNPTDLFKNESSFELTILDVNHPFDTTVIKSIHPDSEIITQLKDWIGENSWEWLETPYSYTEPVALLKGSNFKFLLYPTFVVISYKDTKGKVRQFFKDADYERFYFITFKKKKHKKESWEFEPVYPDRPN